jgi:hypothetical protein
MAIAPLKRPHRLLLGDRLGSGLRGPAAIKHFRVLVTGT